MKKMMLLAALMGLTTAAAANTAVTGTVKFMGKVVNVCVISTTTGVKVANTAQSFGTVPANLPDYNANQISPQGASVSSTGTGLALKCTKDTPLSLTATPDDGTTTGPTAFSSTSPIDTGPVAMNLSKGTDKLAGKYQVTLNKANTGNGDIWSGSARFDPTAGQWNTPAGNYEGTLTIKVEYN